MKLGIKSYLLKNNSITWIRNGHEWIYLLLVLIKILLTISHIALILTTSTNDIIHKSVAEHNLQVYMTL